MSGLKSIEGERKSTGTAPVTRRECLNVISKAAAGLGLGKWLDELSIVAASTQLANERSLIALDHQNQTANGRLHVLRPVVDLRRILSGSEFVAYLVGDAEVDGLSRPVIGLFGAMDLEGGGRIVPVGHEGVVDVQSFRRRLGWDAKTARKVGEARGVMPEIVFLTESLPRGWARAEVNRPQPNGDWLTQETVYRVRDGRREPTGSWRLKPSGEKLNKSVTKFTVKK